MLLLLEPLVQYHNLGFKYSKSLKNCLRLSLIVGLLKWVLFETGMFVYTVDMEFYFKRSINFF